MQIIVYTFEMRQSELVLLATLFRRLPQLIISLHLNRQHKIFHLKKEVRAKFSALRRINFFPGIIDFIKPNMRGFDPSIEVPYVRWINKTIDKTAFWISISNS